MISATKVRDNMNEVLCAESECENCQLTECCIDKRNGYGYLITGEKVKIVREDKRTQKYKNHMRVVREKNGL